MAKLYLKLDDEVIREIPLSREAVTIGRLPDNTVQVDHIAVSGHHCRVSWHTGHYVITDTNSLNGVYVNSEQVREAELKDRDEILIGKHTLRFEDDFDAQEDEPLFSQAASGVSVQPAPAELATVTAVAPEVTPAPSVSTASATSQATVALRVASAAPSQERVGILTVIEGKTDEPMYVLSDKLTIIGKDEMASIQLKGWFAPKVAANVMRRDSRYLIAAADKDVRISINGENFTGQHELNEGDKIDVSGFKFQFNFRE